jgi:HTH-type transcriptional regulator/antitoxin HipB
MKHTPQSIGQLIRATRKKLGITQKDLALTTGTGLRFLTDLENGKPTCQIGKVLTILHAIGIAIDLTPPKVKEEKDHA